MKKEIMQDKEKLMKIVADADSYLKHVQELLVVGDLDMEEFKETCNGATRAIIIKAAINSMRAMQ